MHLDPSRKIKKKKKPLITTNTWEKTLQITPDCHTRVATTDNLGDTNLCTHWLPQTTKQLAFSGIKKKKCSSSPTAAALCRRFCDQDAPLSLEQTKCTNV